MVYSITLLSLVWITPTSLKFLLKSRRLEEVVPLKLWFNWLTFSINKTPPISLHVSLTSKPLFMNPWESILKRKMLTLTFTMSSPTILIMSLFPKPKLKSLLSTIKLRSTRLILLSYKSNWLTLLASTTKPRLKELTPSITPLKLPLNLRTKLLSSMLLVPISSDHLWIESYLLTLFTD